MYPRYIFARLIVDLGFTELCWRYTAGLCLFTALGRQKVRHLKTSNWKQVQMVDQTRSFKTGVNCNITESGINQCKAL